MKKTGIKGKAAFEPIRIALTGETHGCWLICYDCFIWEEEIRTAFKRQPPILLKCDLNYFWKIFTGIYRKFYLITKTSEWGS